MWLCNITKVSLQHFSSLLCKITKHANIFLTISYYFAHIQTDQMDARTVSYMHTHTHTHTHTLFHTSCSQQMFCPPLPSQKPTSERIFPPQGWGAKPLKKTAAPQHKTKHQREKKNVQKNLSKRKGREKSKGFSNPSFIEVAGFRQRNLFYVWEAWPVIWVATTTRGTCNKTRRYSGMLCNNGRHHPLLLLEMEGWMEG